MLREFPAVVRAGPHRIAALLVVASMAIAMTGCGIKGPLRPATPPPPPPATDIGPPAPAPAPPAPANQ